MIESRDLTFTYENAEEGIEAVNFRIGRGEVVLLTGRSGSGKSTLLKCLNGIIPHLVEGKLDGTLSLCGADYRDCTMGELSHNIGSVFQNPRSQFFSTNSTAELVFAMENYGYTKERMEERLSAMREEFPLEKALDRDIYTLSSGERQLLAIASSKVLDPKVLLFDEPSANLDYGNIMLLRTLILRMKAQGISVVVADHRFFYLEGLLDKILLMEEGRLSCFEDEASFRESGYAARAFTLFGENAAQDARCTQEEKTMCEKLSPTAVLRDVGYREILRGINLELFPGEVTVLIGANGAGKTTLGRILCRTIEPTSGKIETKGKPFYVMQDADFQLFGTSVAEEFRIMPKPPSEKRVKEILEKLDLARWKDSHPFALSGGQKQRLQLGLALVCGSELILLDEPTSGLDLSSMDTVAKHVREMAKRAAVLVISHDYEFIRKTADRIVYLEDGIIRDAFRPDEASGTKLEQAFCEMGRKYEEYLEN